MPLLVIDGRGDDQVIDSEGLGTLSQPTRIIGKNSEQVLTALQAIRIAVEALSNIVDSGALAISNDSLAALVTHTDGLEGLLATTNTALATLQGYQDGVEGLIGTTNTTLGATNTTLSTLAGYVDTLETLIATTNTALGTLQGYVDGLEGLITATNAAQASSATLYPGTAALSTTAAAIGSSQACREVLVQNDPDNTVDILVGNVSAQTLQLVPGQAVSIVVANVATIYAKSVSGTPALNWMARS